MVTSLVGSYTDNTGLFKQVILGSGTIDSVFVKAKVHQHVLSKSRRVVVSDGLRVTESLQDRVTGKNFLTNIRFISGLIHGGKLSEELHTNLSRFSLSSSRFARDDNTLSTTFLTETVVGLG